MVMVNVRVQICWLVLVANGCTGFFSRPQIPQSSYNDGHDLLKSKAAKQPTKSGKGRLLLRAPEVEKEEEHSISPEENAPRRNAHSLYLFSLPASQEATSAHATLLIKRLWEFKDEVLGDGRDFFVPRPKTLSALNHILCEQINATEVVVLSNCARFDVIIVMENHDTDLEANSIRKNLAHALWQQYGHYKDQTQQKRVDLTSWLDGGDNPKRLLQHPKPLEPSRTAVDALDVKLLSINLLYLESPETIALYLCRVATGLQAQGRRPDRDVAFRPFSSRDAHVMLQLKRTADIASKSSKQPRIKALLDTALQSGKAARDPAIVPAILPLKKFGSGGSSSRYSLGDAPIDLTVEASKVSEKDDSNIDEKLYRLFTGSLLTSFCSKLIA